MAVRISWQSSTRVHHMALRENYGTELQQNQRTLQILKIMVGCRSNSVQVYVNCFQIIGKKTLGKFQFS